MCNGGRARTEGLEACDVRSLGLEVQLAKEARTNLVQNRHDDTHVAADLELLLRQCEQLAHHVQIERHLAFKVRPLDLDRHRGAVGHEVGAVHFC